MHPSFNRPLWVTLAVLSAALTVLLLRRPEEKAARVPADVSPAQSQPATEQIAPPQPAASLTGADPLPPELFAGQRAGRPRASAAELISRLRDTALPEKTRSAAAFDLARLGADEVMANLRTILSDASASATLKAAIAEALGECPHPEARPLLKQLAQAADETIARGAVRGLPAMNDRTAVDDLALLLDNDRTTASVRSEAALALGTVEQPEALDALKSALVKAGDSPLAKDVIEGIGRRPFHETHDFFREYFQDAKVPADLRQSAFESLAQSEGDTAPFLLSFAKDPDPKARAAVAWALSVSDNPGPIGSELVSLLQAELDETVRLRLYQALARQTQFDAQAVQNLVAGERDPGTRLEGFNALAAAARTPEATAYFDQHAVPELAQTAVNGESLQHCLSSVVTLQRAKTPAARAALESIVQGGGDSRVVKAAQAALGRHHTSAPPR